MRSPRYSPWTIIAGEVGVDGTEADGAAVRGHHSADQPVTGAEDSRSCAGRVSRVAGRGKVVPLLGRSANRKPLPLD
jgi:hypothetical protein